MKMSNSTFWTGNKESVPVISIDTSKLLYVRYKNVEQPTVRGTSKTVPGIEFHFINGETLTLVTHQEVDGLAGFYELIGAPPLEYPSTSGNQPHNFLAESN